MVSSGDVGPDTAYRGVRDFTEALADPLSAEDQTVQSMPDVSPTKWHRAHTTWFFETFVLDRYAPDYKAFDPAYSYLFNSYYESVGPRYMRSQRGCVSRPGCQDIANYRCHVDGYMLDLIERGDLDDLGIALLDLGINHEQQHQELLLMDIKHVLSMSPLESAYATPAPGRAEKDSIEGCSRTGWTGHEGGLVRIGHDGGEFAYDNEGPAHCVYLQPFELADRLVTCGEWLAFIADGGYRRPELWLAEGWDRLHANLWDAPLYWDCSDGDWALFTLAGRRRFDPDEPVCHVSYFEADAYASWAGARLPNEFEWETVACGMLDTAVGFTGQLDDPRRVHPRVQREAEMFGGAWAWTSSAYLPYPGFRPAAGAVGEYNGKFMVNQQVLRGGSAATPLGHIRATYRNFYPPHARWAFSGVRLAKDV